MTTPRAPKSRKRPVNKSPDPVQPATPERCSCEESLRLRAALRDIQVNASLRGNLLIDIRHIASEALK